MDDNKGTVLITGAAGFIGSYMTKLLKSASYRVVGFDNLSTGSKTLVKYSDVFIEGDLKKHTDVNKLFQQFKFDYVLHFAASLLVEESVLDPIKYYRNNIEGICNLLQAMVSFGVKNIVFSSTCSVYGNQMLSLGSKKGLDESVNCNPLNPYGRSKLYAENIIKDIGDSNNIKSVIFRYFNAAGADPELDLGEDHEHETRIIPRCVENALGNCSEVEIFGNNYDTPDGTCIRDYLHVHDLCHAHMLGMEFLKNGKNSSNCSIFNLSNDTGFSVKEICDTATTIFKKYNLQLNIKFSKRRKGDPAILIGDSTKAKKTLGWECKFNLIDIIKTTLLWKMKKYKM